MQRRQPAQIDKLETVGGPEALRRVNTLDETPCHPRSNRHKLHDLPPDVELDGQKRTFGDSGRGKIHGGARKSLHIPGLDMNIRRGCACNPLTEKDLRAIEEREEGLQIAFPTTAEEPVLLAAGESVKVKRP